jgi:hypothetical protein
MQISSLLNPTNDTTQEYSNNLLIRFARFLNEDTWPNEDEVKLYLNNTYKSIFMRMASEFFCLDSKQYKLSVRDFGIILWKISLLRRITNRGRKRKETQKLNVVFDIQNKNISNTEKEKFQELGDDMKEERCLLIWKNLRKYFHFIPTEYGWNVNHILFKTINNVEQIPHAVECILPLRSPNNRRRKAQQEKQIKEEGDTTYAQIVLYKFV